MFVAGLITGFFLGGLIASIVNQSDWERNHTALIKLGEILCGVIGLVLLIGGIWYAMSN
jgi:hypothetical protein